MRLKIVICANTSWNLVNFRSGLIRSLVADGFEVIAIAPFDSYSSRVEDLGARYIRLDFDGHSRGVLNELKLLIRMIRIIGSERPDIFLGFTIKPNVYGSIAARIYGASSINNIAGLGIASSSSSWLSSVSRFLYRLSLRKSFKVFFQNSEDREAFVNTGIVKSSRTAILPGSGVDLNRFEYSGRGGVAGDRGKTVFIFVGRLIWEKGIREFVEAARLCQASGANVEFRLLGTIEERNPKSVRQEDIDGWMQEGVVHYKGSTDDVRPFMEDADCVVLPTYYGEGTPRTLLEAAALGRPIITSDWSGCRDVVEDGVNGYLCEPRNTIDLHQKLIKFHQLSADQRSRMGLAGRDKVERQYDEDIVIGCYRDAIQALRRQLPAR